MNKYMLNDAINCLDIDIHFFKEGINYAEEKCIDSIRIRTLNGNSGQSYPLDFSLLEGKTFIRRLVIRDDFKINKIISLKSLYTLNNLLHFECMHALKIDMSYLPSLSSLYIKDDKKIENIGSITHLRELLITSTKYDDCTHLSTLKELEELRLCGKIKSLKGIESLSRLHYLKVSYCSDLVDLEALNKLVHLKKVHVERCKKIMDFTFLIDNPYIEDLFIDNLDSVGFVEFMPNLKKFNFWNCKDGNMNPLLKSQSLETVNFYPNKRHYTHTLEAIKDMRRKKE